MKALIIIKKEKPHTLIIKCEKTDESEEDFKETFDIEKFYLTTEP